MTQLSLLSQLQHDFGRSIRTPGKYPTLTGVTSDTISVYHSLVYSTLYEVTSQAFPVLFEVLGSTSWEKLVRLFLKESAATTPYFYQIPEIFLNYLETLSPKVMLAEGLPVYLYDLAHYEWIELALELADIDLDDIGVDQTTSLKNGVAVLSPLAWVVAYDYPVHQINVENMQVDQSDCYFIVYRNRQDQVKFMEIDENTVQLLSAIAHNLNDKSPLETVSLVKQNTKHQQSSEQGLALLEKFKQLDIILGVRSETAIN